MVLLLSILNSVKWETISPALDFLLVLTVESHISFSIPCVNAESQELTTQQSRKYAYYKHFVCIVWVVINISWVFEDSLISYLSMHLAKHYLDLYTWICKRLRKTHKKENSFQAVPLMYINDNVKTFAFLCHLIFPKICRILKSKDRLIRKK